jgi:hypothetical protein
MLNHKTFTLDGAFKSKEFKTLCGLVRPSPERLQRVFPFKAFCFQGPGITTGALPDKGNCISGVILRAIRKRDIKTFSDALAVDFVPKVRGPK